MELWAGQPVASAIETRLHARIETFKARHGRSPSLAVVLVGDDPASHVYVKHKQQACIRLGLLSQKIQLPHHVSQAELLQVLWRLNDDAGVDGILVQMPLPPHIEVTRVLDAIAPAKDPDGLTPENMGLLLSGRPRAASCTPSGVMELLRHYGFDVAGKRAIVVGRSLIVGKPMAQLLVEQHATVTVIHSKTKESREHTLNGELVIVAAGRARFFGGQDFAPGAVVVDVGIHRSPDGKLCGDVRSEELTHCKAVTPVPGGVGPLTIAMLMQNTVHLAELAHN